MMRKKTAFISALLITPYFLLITFLASCSSVHKGSLRQNICGCLVVWTQISRQADFLRRDLQHVCDDLRPQGISLRNRLKVTNTENNRSAECIVNDRGPFVEDRDIDLSYAVAKEIGVTGPGIARVLLEPLGRDNSYIRPVKFRISGKTGPFAVQVGSFTENINAIRLKTGLRLKYSNVYIQETEVKGETYYRVRVGNYQDYNSAVSAAEQLGQEGYPALLLKADVKI